MKSIIKIKADAKDLTEKLQKIFADLDNSKETVIEFEKGTYYFYRKGSKTHKIFASSAPSGYNHVIFPIFHAENVTIDGNGSDFVFCDRIQPFMITNSKNITLKNFHTDFSFLRYAYGQIRAVNENGFEVHIDKKLFNYYIANGNLHFVCGEDVLSTKMRKISMKRILPEKSGVYFIYGEDTQARINKAAPTVFIKAEETSCGVFFRYGKDAAHVNFNIGDTICLAYDNDREAQTFFFEDCQNITLENITIHRGGGMGFVADVCENITLNNFKIQKKEGREEYYTTTADGVFLTNCSGDFILKNSLIRDTYDDAMNIHGFYIGVKSVLENNEAELEHLHLAHNGLKFCKIGDILRVSRKEDFHEIGMIKVLAVNFDDERKSIRIKHDGAVDLPIGALIENAGRMPNVTIESCRFINCPHIRLSSKNMLVRNNEFALNVRDLYIWDLIDFWAECGATERLEIINNRFLNTSDCNIEIGSCRPLTSNRLHDKIIIKNNQFMYAKEQALRISAVNVLEIENNTFGEKIE